MIITRNEKLVLIDEFEKLGIVFEPIDKFCGYGDDAIVYKNFNGIDKTNIIMIFGNTVRFKILRKTIFKGSDNWNEFSYDFFMNNYLSEDIIFLYKELFKEH